MCRYLIEASRKQGIFEPYEQMKYCLVTREKLCEMLLHSATWAVWSAKWVNLDLTPFEQLESIYGKIDILE